MTGRMATLSTCWWAILCLVAATISSTSAQQCVLDLNFAVDSSGSIISSGEYNISYRNWDKTLYFVANLTSRFTIGPNDVQVAFVLFSHNAAVEWNLTRYQDKASLITAITNVRYIGSRTNLNDALYLTRTQVFAPGGGTRPNANKVTVIVTDGVDNVPTSETELTIQNATACKNDGIRLIAIGVSDKVNTERLRLQIASSPSDYYALDDFNALPRLVSELTPTICVTTITRTHTTAASGPDNMSSVSNTARTSMTSSTVTVVSTKSGNSLYIIIGLVVPCIGVTIICIIVIAVLVYRCRGNKKRCHTDDDYVSPNVIIEDQHHYDVIQRDQINGDHHLTDDNITESDVVW